MLNGIKDALVGLVILLVAVVFLGVVAAVCLHLGVDPFISLPV